MGAVGGVERGDHNTAVGMKNLNDNLEVSAGRFLSVKNESLGMASNLRIRRCSDPDAKL
jgi:hypothetical protein